LLTSGRDDPNYEQYRLPYLIKIPKQKATAKCKWKGCFWWLKNNQVADVMHRKRNIVAIETKE
jgi:hypothetical protein